jgi:hypothetical protein
MNKHHCWNPLSPWPAVATKWIVRLVYRATVVLGFLLPGIIYGQVPPPGGWSFPTNLDSWTFTDPTNWPTDKGYAPLSFTNISGWQYQGDISTKYALTVDTTNAAAAWLQYNLVETNGAANLTLDVGAITLWFSPNWSSASTNGVGPGIWSELLSVGQWTTNAALGYWGLSIDAGGTNVYFASQDNAGSQATYLSAPIAWNTNEWHFLGLTYSPTNSALYLDGELVTNGTAVTVFPGSNALTGGLFIGSDTYGFAQARGLFDDIYTFGNPLSETDIRNIYNSQYVDYLLNPYNYFMRPSIVSAPSSPSYTSSGWYAITGPGVLTWVTNMTSCVTSSNVWLTNITATVTTNGVNVTFGIAGGLDGAAYDVFANAALGPSDPNYQWAWMGQGYHCNIYLITNLPPTSAFLILGTPQDSDLDGLTDAYERLISHTDPNNPDTDGDGVSDAIEVLQGRNPLVPGAVADTGGAILFDVYTPFN